VHYSNLKFLISIDKTDGKYKVMSFNLEPKRSRMYTL
jgi:hypothetical protein